MTQVWRYSDYTTAKTSGHLWSDGDIISIGTRLQMRYFRDVREGLGLVPMWGHPIYPFNQGSHLPYPRSMVKSVTRIAGLEGGVDPRQDPNFVTTVETGTIVGDTVTDRRKTDITVAAGGQLTCDSVYKLQPYFDANTILVFDEMEMDIATTVWIGRAKHEHGWHFPYLYKLSTGTPRLSMNIGGEATPSAGRIDIYNDIGAGHTVWVNQFATHGQLEYILNEGYGGGRGVLSFLRSTDEVYIPSSANTGYQYFGDISQQPALRIQVGNGVTAGRLKTAGIGLYRVEVDR